MWNETIEEKYNQLLRRYEILNADYDKLKEKYEKTDDELMRANYKIQYELEPRLKTERRNYDNYVLSGGSSCFTTGMNGGCGLDCKGFGTQSGCSEILSDIEDKELLKYYEEHEAFDGNPIIRKELIGVRELAEDVYQADVTYCHKCINALLKQKNNINQTIDFYKSVIKKGYQK